MILSLPQGVVTFLMTDIEGSTRHWEQHPLEMRDALIRHDQQAAEILSEHGGSLIKQRGGGDSLFVVFSSPQDALRAAIALQSAFSAANWNERIQLRIRIALHTGEIERTDDIYHGLTLNDCNRLRSLGHGGQIILSEATFAQTKALSNEIGFRYLGTYALQEGARVGKIYQAHSLADAALFPRLRYVAPPAHNLPQQVTRFWGREALLREILSALPSHRLVTLVGEGGIGKTRIALQVCQERLRGEGDALCYVDFAQAGLPDRIKETFANALQIPLEGEAPLLERIFERIGSLAMLLVWDSCENLPAECICLVEALLAHCPETRILACSPRPLGVLWEHVLAIPPLTPPVEATPENLVHNEAAALFVDRATLALPNFSLNAENARHIADICHLLQGVPYAIELVAARFRERSLEEIHENLAQQLHPHSNAPLSSEATLQAVIDWSHASLSESERTLLRRLAFLPSAWTLEAVEQVCTDAIIELWEALDILTSLTDKSLIIYQENEGRPHYRLHEVTRRYARAKLADSGEEESLQSRYAAYREQIGDAL